MDVQKERNGRLTEAERQGGDAAFEKGLARARQLAQAHQDAQDLLGAGFADAIADIRRQLLRTMQANKASAIKVANAYKNEIAGRGRLTVGGRMLIDAATFDIISHEIEELTIFDKSIANPKAE